MALHHTESGSSRCRLLAYAMQVLDEYTFQLAVYKSDNLNNPSSIHVTTIFLDRHPDICGILLWSSRFCVVRSRGEGI